MRLRVIWIGKTRNAAARAWGDEYVQRIRRFARIETEELTDRDPEATLLRRAEGSRLVILEPDGRSFDSPAFARYLDDQFAHGGRELILAIGGAEGFSTKVRQRAQQRLSLSGMTFSHELARVMLLEQIYRACTILANHPYAK